ncbi:CHAT domain-containing protein [Cryptosporangium minutisporangium]|uniref:CHAT domain-containing protein n=1 Tax=Cryptosporangium minutisporangium TaxID=113569 RepID=UPI0035EBD4D0
MRSTSFDQAVDALRLAEADPGRSVVAATAVARRARRQGEHAAASVAERALGIAALHLRNTDVATRHLRAAVVLGRRAGEVSLVTEARLRLAAVLNLRGRVRTALREIEAAAAEATGTDRARALAQHGAILLELGRLDDARGSLDVAVPALRAAGDRMWLKRALANRGLINGRRFRFDAAEADLTESLRINRALGVDLSVAFLLQNLGWVDTLRGDVPRALHRLDDAEAQLRKLGAQVGLLLEDRALLLLSAGMTGEARATSQASVAALERERQHVALPRVRVLLAQAALAESSPDEALAQARRALAESVRQRRPEWASFARYVVAAARAADAGERTRISVAALQRTAVALDAAGWPDVAVHAWLLTAELAFERGRTDRGVAALRTASRARQRRPAATRTLGWYAEAQLRLRQGRRPGALRAARAGLRVLDEHRARLGAADLRAHSAAQRGALAGLGLRLAIGGGRASDVFAWAERGRASHLLLPPLRPLDEGDDAVDLAALRAAVADVDRLRNEGVDPAPALRRQEALERRIRDRARRRPGSTSAEPLPPVRDATLRAALAGSTLVEYIVSDGALGAVVVAPARTTWHALGPVAPIRGLVDRLPFAVHRLASGRATVLPLLRDAASRLDRLLLVPLAAHLGDGPVVVVPTGPLHSLPWSLLPSCAGRPVTVAPSATLWHAASAPVRSSAAPSDAVVVAGPGLPGAEDEVDAVAAIHRTTPLSGPDAQVETTLRRLAGADVAHLAAHGTIHREHPLFSSVLLADGPLTCYDLERVRPLPRLVVLAGCETGRHGVPAGDELIGLAATLLARGTVQVVASVLPIPDAATAPLMTLFHERLAAGASSAVALAEAQTAVAGEGGPALAAAAGFVCIGGEFRLRSATAVH